MNLSLVFALPFLHPRFRPPLFCLFRSLPPPLPIFRWRTTRTPYHAFSHPRTLLLVTKSYLRDKNGLEIPNADISVSPKGGRVNGASPSYTPDEMTYALNTAKSTLLITVPASLPVALAAADAAGIPRNRVLLLEGVAEGFVSVQDLMKKGEEYDQQVECWRIPRGKTNREVCGYLNFSSGTVSFSLFVRGGQGWCG